MRLALASLATAALVLATAAPAVAQDEPEPTKEQRAEAARRYREALGLYDDGYAAAALPLFRDALEITGSPNARLMVARCLRQVGRPADAYRELQRVIADAQQRDDPKYRKAKASAETELQSLEAEVAKLTITLAEPPPGASIQLDGVAVEPDSLDQPIVVKPGEHEVVATAEGHEPFARKVQLAAGASASVEVDLAAPPPPEPEPESEAATPPPPPASPPEPTGGSLRTAGYVVGGVGVVGLGVFVTTGLMAQGKYDQVYDACGGERCTDSSYEDDIDSGKSLETIANISLAVGVVGVLAGSAMVLFGGPREREAAPVSAMVLPGGGALSYSGRF